MSVGWLARKVKFGNQNNSDRRIDLPNCYCVIDVLLCMVFTHSTDLSIEVSIVIYNGDLVDHTM